MNHLLRNKADNSVGMRAYAYKKPEKMFGATAATLIAAAIAAVASGTATAVGASQSAKAQKLQQQKMWQTKAGELAELKRKREENYLDTAAGQNVVRQAREIADRSTKQARGSQAMGGGTDAAVALSKEQANKTVSDAMANIASNDTERKDKASDQMREAERYYGMQEANLEAQRANNISNVASQAGNAISSMGNAVASAYANNGVQTKASVGKVGAVGSTPYNNLYQDPNK